MQCVGTLSWSVMGSPSVGRTSRANAARQPMMARESGVPPAPRKASAAIPAGATRTGTARGEERALEIDWSQIVRRCMDGDSGAWAELVRTHHRRVYALCY